jgi:hypothetical protein
VETDICPYLDLGEETAASPAPGRRCGALKPPRAIAEIHQRTFCLTGNHIRCTPYIVLETGQWPGLESTREPTTAGLSGKWLQRLPWIALGLILLAVGVVYCRNLARPAAIALRATATTPTATEALVIVPTETSMPIPTGIATPTPVASSIPVASGSSLTLQAEPGVSACITVIAQLLVAMAEQVETPTPLAAGAAVAAATPAPSMIVSMATPANSTTAEVRTTQAAPPALTVSTYTPVPTASGTPVIVLALPSPGSAAIEVVASPEPEAGATGWWATSVAPSMQAATLTRTSTATGTETATATYTSTWTPSPTETASATASPSTTLTPTVTATRAVTATTAYTPTQTPAPTVTPIRGNWAAAFAELFKLLLQAQQGGSAAPLPPGAGVATVAPTNSATPEMQAARATLATQPLGTGTPFPRNTWTATSEATPPPQPSPSPQSALRLTSTPTPAAQTGTNPFPGLPQWPGRTLPQPPKWPTPVLTPFAGFNTSP